MKPTLAVVVIGRNEGERLTLCLDSVQNMDATAFEKVGVIYADSASTDDSVARAHQAGARVIHLPAGPTTAARGRNAGWKAVDAEFVLFLDGDTILDRDFVTHALQAFSDQQTAVVWGHRREIRPRASLYNRVLDLDWIYKPGPSEFCGGDALMRRAVLQEIQGYNEDLIAGEEPEMCGRMRARGYRILHIDCAMTGHDLAIRSWRQYWKRAVRAGFAYASVSERFRGSSQPLWRHEARRNRLHAAGLLSICTLGLGASVYLFSPFPLIGMALILGLLVLRTMRRISWKSPNDRLTCFLYGVHSHLQQIPILFGQMKFYRERGGKHRLIEYKEATP